MHFDTFTVASILAGCRVPDRYFDTRLIVWWNKQDNAIVQMSGIDPDVYDSHDFHDQCSLVRKELLEYLMQQIPKDSKLYDIVSQLDPRNAYGLDKVSVRGTETAYSYEEDVFVQHQAKKLFGLQPLYDQYDGISAKRSPTIVDKDKFADNCLRIISHINKSEGFDLSEFRLTGQVCNMPFSLISLRNDSAISVDEPNAGHISPDVSRIAGEVKAAFAVNDTLERLSTQERLDRIPEFYAQFGQFFVAHFFPWAKELITVSEIPDRGVSFTIRRPSRSEASNALTIHEKLRFNTFLDLPLARKLTDFIQGTILVYCDERLERRVIDPSTPAGIVEVDFNQIYCDGYDFFKPLLLRMMDDMQAGSDFLQSIIIEHKTRFPDIRSLFSKNFMVDNDGDVTFAPQEHWPNDDRIAMVYRVCQEMGQSTDSTFSEIYVPPDKLSLYSHGKGMCHDSSYLPRDITLIDLFFRKLYAGRLQKDSMRERAITTLCIEL